VKELRSKYFAAICKAVDGDILVSSNSAAEKMMP
jgi:hypothetical protein